ncbi:hypothetical protein B0J17DRAFT_763459 [Rhizoctonia solani]|nr:hypothetical protein B0J17DRAFT_763459 [Rhizoctonia solani]
MKSSKLKLHGHAFARFSRYWGRLQRTDTEVPTTTARAPEEASSPAGVKPTRSECTKLSRLNEATTLVSGDITEVQCRAALIHTPSSGVLETLGAALADLETVLDVLPSLRSVVSGLRVCLELVDINLDIQEVYGNVRERLMDAITTHQRETPAFKALYNAVLPTEIHGHTCAPITYLETLDTLRTWATKTDGPKILWMTGVPGSGKTTVTHAICGQFDKEERLGASFFCSGIISECRDARRIIPTIAFQLARFSKEYWGELFSPLEVQSDVAALDVAAQFNRLLVTPLLRVKETLPRNTIVVIDALDECVDTSNARAFLELLLRHVDELPIKFLLTSRPQLAISLTLSLDRTVQYYQIDQSTQVRLYLDEVLSPIPLNGINRLSEITGCQFIFATTAARYLLPEYEVINNIHRLATVLYVQTGSNDANETKLDKLYATILSNAFDDRDSVEVNSRQLVLWTVVRAREPITTMAIVELLGLITREDVVLAIRPLWSVVHLSSTTGVISLRHTTFRDFLLDPKRSGKYHCYEAEQSEFLACRCFVVMQKSLRFNICDLETSTMLDKDVPDLHNRIVKAIPPVLSNACRHWSKYLKKAEPSSRAIEHLYGFLRRRLLFWMEVLNLKGWIEEGEAILLQTLDWLSIANTAPELQKFVVDAQDFVRAYSTSATSNSTPHIYVSALPFVSKESWIYESYWPQTQGLFVVRGIPKATHRRQKHHTTSAALSPDGTRVATGSESGTIFVWDLTNDSRLFGPVSISTDVSTIRSIAFSPDGTFIASGSDKGKVGIWNGRTGQTLGSLLSNNRSRVLSVAFSPDGSSVLISCEDGTVQTYNLGTHTLRSGWSVPARLVRHFTFSPDGSYALFTEPGGRNTRLHIFNSPESPDTKSSKRIDFDGTGVFAISPDGRRIASTTMRGEILIWDLHSRALVVGPFKGHNASLVSIAFSPDGKRLVTSSYDQTLRIWDAYEGTSLAPPLRKPWIDLESARDEIHAAEFATFAPDSNHVISVWGNGTICSWNLQDPRFNAVRSTSGSANPDFYSWRESKLGQWVEDSKSRLILCVPREYDDILVSLPDPSLAPCSSIIGHDRAILGGSEDIMTESAGANVILAQWMPIKNKCHLSRHHPSNLNK